MGHTVSAPVALVTGAARGIGRGVALALGESGAIVHVSDQDGDLQQSTSRGTERTTLDLPGTVDATAQQVDARGGTGIAHVVDHTDPVAVQTMFGDIERRHGGVDLVVANAFDGNALPFSPAPFWELPTAHWENMMEAGVRSHLDTARSAAPMLIRRTGLLVLTGYRTPTDGSLGHVYYDLAMTSISRLGQALAHDLASHGVAVVTLSPGFTRTEAILAAFGDDPLPPGSQSVELCGRVVREVLRDSDRMRLTGRTIEVVELADWYAVSDVPSASGREGATP